MSSSPPPLLAETAVTLTGQTPSQVRDDGVWFIDAAHDAADALARELRAAHRETGWWPLLTSELDVDEIWEAALDADVLIGSAAVEEVSDGDLEALLSDYAEGVALPTQVNAKPAVSGPLDTVGGIEWTGVLLVPCTVAWAALPFIGFGAFGNCPDPVDQGAVARWLFEQHGSDPIAVGADCVVYRSLRPVAHEHLTSAVRVLLSYCSTLLEQDIDPDELAGLLAVGGHPARSLVGVITCRI